MSVLRPYYQAKTTTAQPSEIFTDSYTNSGCTVMGYAETAHTPFVSTRHFPLERATVYTDRK